MSLVIGEPLPAPDLEGWLNAPQDFALADLRGRVVVIEAFQMLCPGCVQAGLPQLARVYEQFPARDVAVIGLHTVFEHHAVQGGRAPLAAFLGEYRYGFPVGIDRPSETGSGLPNTMRAYGLQGTPTLLLVDRQGKLHLNAFGHIPDLRLGAEIMALVAERGD